MAFETVNGLKRIASPGSTGEGGQALDENFTAIGEYMVGGIQSALVAENDAGGQSITNLGPVTAASFAGEGSGLTLIPVYAIAGYPNTDGWFFSGEGWLAYNIDRILSGGNDAGSRALIGLGNLVSVVLEATNYLVLKAPDNSRWKITVNNSGVLQTEAL